MDLYLQGKTLGAGLGATLHHKAEWQHLLSHVSTLVGYDTQGVSNAQHALGEHLE